MSNNDLKDNPDFLKWHPNHVLTDHGIEISGLRNAPTELAKKVLENELERVKSNHGGGNYEGKNNQHRIRVRDDKGRFKEQNI